MMNVASSEQAKRGRRSKPVISRSGPLAAVFAVLLSVSVTAVIARANAPAANKPTTTGLQASGTEHNGREEHARLFFTKELKSPTPIYRGWARLYLGQELDKGNADIRAAYADILRQTGKGASEMTPEIAGDEEVKWQLRNWMRIYFEFGDGGRTARGRLEPETIRLVETLFWNYVCNRSHWVRASRPASDVYGTENHEMMHYGNVLMALQALKSSPAYRDRALPEDGHTVREHFEAWNTYYKEHFVARARFGDQIELFSGYWKYTMPEIFNMCDLADDAVLRKRAGMLLDVLWADWAIGQLNGVRGGCRTRIYQELSETADGETRRGSHDSWLEMSRILRDRDTWWQAQVHPHPIRGMPRVLAMTGYRFPALVEELAADAAGRGESVYVARRMSKQRAEVTAEDQAVKSNMAYVGFDIADTRMLSYEYCTPDYVMGALMIDPTLKLVDAGAKLGGHEAGYPGLTAQNRYHAIQFATGVDAHVVPQCLGLKNGKTYNQQQAVQHKNIQLVQRNKNGKQTGPMRIFFSKGMKERLIETNGWYCLQEGCAFLAVKAFALSDTSAVSCSWDNEFWLRPRDPNVPVALVAGRQPTFHALADFIAYVGGFAARAEGSRFSLAGTEPDGTACTLTLQTDFGGVPEVNGKPVNFTPKKLYDSPFLDSDYGSGIVTIRKGSRQYVLDFTKADGESRNER